MSAVLEYLAAEIIEVSDKACKATVQYVENSDSDDVTEIFVILPKHIKHVVGQDEELSALFSDTKIMMWGGGKSQTQNCVSDGAKALHGHLQGCRADNTEIILLLNCCYGVVPVFIRESLQNIFI